MTIFPYIFNKEDTLEIIQNKFHLNSDELVTLNPMLRNKKPHLGQIIYLKQNHNEINITLIKNELSKLNHIAKDKYVSYYLKHNDHSLIEKEVTEKIHYISTLIFSDINNQTILESHFLLIKNTLTTFFDSLIDKNEEKMIEIKKDININVKNLISFLNANNIITSQNITKIIEMHLKMFILIIQENYYDLKLLLK